MFMLVVADSMIAKTADFKADGSMSQVRMTICKSGLRAERNACASLCESCSANS